MSTFDLPPIDETQDPGFLDQILAESYPALGQVRGGGPPQSFLEGLGQGFVGGLASRGQRVAQQRAKFEQRQRERQALVDKARLEQAARAAEQSDKIAAEGRAETRTLGAEGRAETRAGNARTQAHDLANPKLTQEMKNMLPKGSPLSRVPVGTPVSQDVLDAYLKPPPREAGESLGSYITVDTPNGPKLMRAGEAARQGFIPVSASPNAKPSTGEQKQALAFYNRGKEALDTLDKVNKSGKTLEERIASVNPALSAFGQRTINPLKGKDRQAYEQAQKAFTQAKLRKESGAAISQAEYDSDANTYFAQPGDSQEVIAQKKAARDGVLDGLRFTAGSAYEEYYGQPAPAQAAGSAASRTTAPKKSLIQLYQEMQGTTP